MIDETTRRQRGEKQTWQRFERRETYERGGDDREKRDVVRCGDRERNAVTIQRQDTIRVTRRRDDAFESIVYIMIYRN